MRAAVVDDVEVSLRHGPALQHADEGARGDDMAFVRDAVRAGGGLGVLPGFLVDDDVAAGALVRVLQRWSVPTGDLYFVHHGGPHLPKKLVAFRDFALEALAARGIKGP